MDLAKRPDCACSMRRVALHAQPGPPRFNGTSGTERHTCNWWDGAWIERSKVAKYRNTQETKCPSAVDNLTWVPQEDCRLPELDDLASGQLHALLQRVGRPLCFVGDSLVRQIFISTQCLLGRDPLASRANADPALTAGRGVRFFDSKFLVADGMDRATGIYYVHIDLPLLFSDRYRRISDCSALVRGSGHHYDKTSLTFTTRQFGPCNTSSMSSVSNHTGCRGNYDAYQSVIKLVRQKLEEHEFRGPVVWASYAPRHFRYGEWNSGGSCNFPTRSGYSGTALADEMPYMYSTMQLYDKAAIKAWEGTRLNFGMLNVSSLTWLRPDAHYGLGAPHSNSSNESIVADCSHYKMVAGGVPDTWVRGLAAVLEARTQNRSRY